MRQVFKKSTQWEGVSLYDYIIEYSYIFGHVHMLDVFGAILY